MSGVILSYRQIDQVKLQCKIDLKQLFPATKKRERERFEKKWNAFVESDPCNNSNSHYGFLLRFQQDIRSYLVCLKNYDLVKSSQIADFL
ncbi:MAG: hypothetical protein K8R28_00320 [Desulfobacterales bacterium]|nr:hypothetical protein [Desulfobacterales bacterium]